MTNNKKISPLGPGAPVSEILLAETAIGVELPPSQHTLAVERYEAVRKHIEREESPLHNRVRLFYPQGSMAIRATIRARRRDDGYDIDIVAELIVPPSMKPAQVLDELYEAINGPKASQYHGKVKRQTRCVTVEYADGMHLDVTPSDLLDERDPRISHIFHAKPEESAKLHRRLVINSYAFVDWFNERAPIDIAFAEAYSAKVNVADNLRVLAEADVEPVPDHSTVGGGKSITIVALQLLKRNRNVRYQARTGRFPPSVMMSKFAGDAAVPGTSIGHALDMNSAHMLQQLEAAEAAGHLIDVRNPCCQDDRFTDRWPENHTAQRLYINDLKLFRRQLDALMSNRLTLAQMKDLLSAMFGEGPAQTVIENYAKRIGEAVQSNSRTVGRGGRIGVATGAVAPAIIKPTPAQPKDHTFYGSRWKRR